MKRYRYQWPVSNHGRGEGAIRELGLTSVEDQGSMSDKTSQCRPPFEDVPSLQHSESNHSLSDVEDGPATPPLTPLESCPFSQLVTQDALKVVDPPHQDMITTKGGCEFDDMWWVYKGDRVYPDVRAWDVASTSFTCEGC